MLAKILGSHQDSQESVIKNMISCSLISSWIALKSSFIFSFASSLLTTWPGMGIHNLTPLVSTKGKTSLSHSAAHSAFSHFKTLS